MSLHAFLFLFAAMIVASEGESLAASGNWVKVNANTYPLTYTYAVPSPNALDSEKANGTYDIYLVAVDFLIPDRFFASPFWYSHLRKDPNVHGIFVVVDHTKQVTGGGLLLGDPDAPAAIWEAKDFAIKASAGHFEGSGKMTEKRLPEGPTVALDVAFDANLWKPAPVVAPTPEDAKRAAASPQAKVYLALLAAVKAGNAAALKDQLSVEGKAQMAGSPAVLAGVMGMLKQVAPNNPRLLRVTIDSKTAALEVLDGASDYSTVEFSLEGAQWKIRSIDSN